MQQRKSPHKNTTQDSSIITVREILFAPVRTDYDVFLINNSQKPSKPGIWVILATETRRKLPWYTVIINALYTSTSLESCNFLSFACDIIKYTVREFRSTRHTQTNGGHRCNQDMGKWSGNKMTGKFWALCLQKNAYTRLWEHEIWLWELKIHNYKTTI